MGKVYQIKDRLGKEALERIEAMIKKASRLTGLASEERQEKYASSLATLPSGGFVRINYMGQSRIVMVVNSPNFVSAHPKAPAEVSIIYESSDDRKGRVLHKSHLPEFLGDFHSFCTHPDRLPIYRGVIRFSSLKDPITIVRVVDHLERNRIAPIEEGVWRAIDAIKKESPLPDRNPSDFA